ncbi:MAG: nickel pincer cofactor biosynthesis protein LarC [Candidatus Dormibacteraeota bacterium]|uniref:Nickel pincer cofactor biosynthesis protein LarC n=1 Tax=Candidatus Dormiibacter inghamiae TaxID=3127013 RepID=A0A934NCT3_9BACT|nr:nickel pincer cofactor biosynthesis protein LarC [Candidatus Dormibacteraeota bacterium]MBJ7606327.1 nickel pincer cofactor biosynthesis protein LarC [Candidatus Dormibacteraeota bacterium]
MIGYFDCPSGISGDMTLGALLDAGADRSLLPRTVVALGLTDEVRVSTRHEERGHLGGTRALVECGEGPSRNLPELKRLVAAAELPKTVREQALSALDLIGVAESRVHGRPLEQLHLHELGGADTLIDLVGSFWLLGSLQLETTYASPLPAPRSGSTAPGTLRILQGSGAVLEPDERSWELVTPTGAAILATVATFERPALALSRVGYGIGGRDEPNNATALWLGGRVAEAAHVTVIETNLDDQAGNLTAALLEDLMAAGALDVTITSALMKKGRPGHVLAALAEPAHAERLARLILERSSSLGVRLSTARRVLAGRRFIEVETPQGKVRVKVKELEGRPVEAVPEYEDCRRLGGDAAGTAHLLRVAAELARRELGL